MDVHEEDRAVPPVPSRQADDTRATARTALSTGAAALAFQPVVQAGHPHRPAFFEGLIRLSDPEGRLIPARDFIDQVEGTPLGRDIDCAALGLGLAALKAHPGLRLSINMSCHSIDAPEWRDTLTRGLDADPLVAERLILEITERAAMDDPDRVAAFMRDVHARGVAFALDDFGAGATSFRYLRDFRFDIVKIDGQFIGGLGYNPDHQVLVKALVSIARHFEMLTVGEKVETASDAAACDALGINCLQGFHFGAPSLRPDWEHGIRRRA
ncbi:MAG: EAL domain-containing protein [Alkalilacustris sp.]